MIRMKTLTEDEIVSYLDLHLKNWTFEDAMIKRDFTFGSFVQAFSFMTAIALEAEKSDHHPDWSNSYNKVSIALTTHSDHGVTQADINLATKISSIYRKYE